MGYVPDGDPHLMPGNAFVEMLGLVVRPNRGTGGEVLTHDSGFSATDATRQPLGGSNNRAITMIAELDYRNATGAQTGEFIKTAFAVSAGSGTANTESAELERIASNGQWTECNAANASRGIGGGREFIFDVAYHPQGSATRDSHNGNLDTPCMVFTNNHDDVMVWPQVDAAGAAFTYDFLIAAAKDLGNFKAKSVENWNDRLYFLNTSESGTRYPQRLRRTPNFDANPDPTKVGAGRRDLVDFSGEGLRCEVLGDVLACYFEDGVAFVRKTGIPTSPDAVQIISKERGAVSTFSVCATGRNEHFIIATDGWWLLDSSGRWTEVGIAEVDGVQVPKWRKTFYEHLHADPTDRARLFTYYDDEKEFVYISFTKSGRGSSDSNDFDNAEIWIYDRRNDRVFRDIWDDTGRPAPATYWSSYSSQLQSGTIWTAATGSWSDFAGSWDALDATFGADSTCHGTTNGYVLLHNPDEIGTWRDGSATTQNPAWSFQTASVPGSSPDTMMQVKQVSLEYINTDNDNAVFSVYTNDNQSLTALNSMLDQGNAGDTETSKLHFHQSATHLGFGMSGTGPHVLVSMWMDYQEILAPTMTNTTI